jgi:Invasin, domain 3
VTVTDATRDGISGQSLTLSSTDQRQIVGMVTDHGDGSYTATVTAPTVAGASTITATDSSAPGLAGTATLTETPGAPARLRIALNPDQIDADGHSTTSATATIVDQYGNPDGKGGDSIKFASSDPGQRIGPVTDNHDGSYTVSITASPFAGPSSISATDSTVNPSLSGLATLDELTPAPGRATAPSIRGARIAHRTWREPGSSAQNPTAPVGSDISFTLNQRSMVALTFSACATGRLARGRCLPPTRRIHRNPACVRLVHVGTIRVFRHAGVNRVHFSGRIDPNTELRVGDYTVTLVASNAAGQKSAASTLRFTIVVG